MNKSKWISVAVLAAACGLVSVHAQTTQKAGIIYVPKVKGQSKQRTDGATRGGVQQPPPVVRVLTPEEKAIVSSPQPTLYWFIDKPTTYECDVLVKTIDDEPVFEQKFKGIKTGGLVPIDLSKSAKKLEPGKDYRFVVLVSVQPAEPASDIESSGTIRYEAPDASLQQQLAGGSAIDKAVAYAGNGYFTDAVATLAKENSPDSKATLSELLQQAKLNVVAE
jgi:hypothetical protein